MPVTTILVLILDMYTYHAVLVKLTLYVLLCVCVCVCVWCVLGSKGQSTKSKTSPATEVPTRSSQRNVKRPRTYDEEIEELELLAKTVRKSKNQKV